MNEAGEQLLTLAEIGATFMGFTAIAGVLATSTQRKVGSRINFWLMIEFSFAMVFFSILPFVFFNFDLPTRTIWAISSILVASFIPVHLLIVSRFILHAIEMGEFNRHAVKFVFPLFIAIFVIQVLNASGIFFEQSYAAYFLGLVFFLLLAFVNFTFLLMEIWQPATEKTDE
jgi:hypothetical protein